ncbi:hypothetical protein [Deinococcus sp. Leaf326]|uniref:hypothetical protein n=1 Tax=Deinococcus sp. Leaf326 TaxID=1736338 RepID=UPI000700C441|nr:hypothetical protein [Deinococcus sp. Leaf326]KQR15596.1 hypothetical protein ASF71_08130 [Deinococcus sp. Leaf326]
MRDNTPTARLEDTPTPEATPGREDRAAAYAALPRVARLIPGAQPWHLTLELDSGEQVDLSPGRMRWAALHPSSRFGPALTVNWAPGEHTVYAVPAELLPELLPYFPGLEEQS